MNSMSDYFVLKLIIGVNHLNFSSETNILFRTSHINLDNGTTEKYEQHFAHVVLKKVKNATSSLTQNLAIGIPSLWSTRIV